MVAPAPALADVLLGAMGENQDVQAAADWQREGREEFNGLERRAAPDTRHNDIKQAVMKTRTDAAPAGPSTAEIAERREADR